MSRPYSNNLHGRIITYYDCTQSSFRFQYRLLTMTTFFEIAVYNKIVSRNNFVSNSCMHTADRHALHRNSSTAEHYKADCKEDGEQAFFIRTIL